MAHLVPLSMVVPLPNGLNGLSMEVSNHLLTGMILQVGRKERSYICIYIYPIGSMGSGIYKQSCQYSTKHNAQVEPVTREEMGMMGM